MQLLWLTWYNSVIALLYDSIMVSVALPCGKVLEGLPYHSTGVLTCYRRGAQQSVPADTQHTRCMQAQHLHVDVAALV
jgi:hypothetical protein